MAKHAESTYKTVQVDTEWECSANCPEHGPFPTKWIRPTQQFHGDITIRWERYVEPWTLEYAYVNIPIPAAKTGRAATQSKSTQRE